LSSFEADVEIARDCQEADAVLTTDCDFLAYAPVRTVWRLVTRTKLLVYNVPELLKAIGYTRIQLTALCIVSRNDYESNVYRLGTPTNYKMIKAIAGAGKVMRPFCIEKKCRSVLPALAHSPLIFLFRRPGNCRTIPPSPRCCTQKQHRHHLPIFSSSVCRHGTDSSTQHSFIRPGYAPPVPAIRVRPALHAARWNIGGGQSLAAGVQVSLMSNVVRVVAAFYDWKIRSGRCECPTLTQNCLFAYNLQGHG
jgi:hypothetical protein